MPQPRPTFSIVTAVYNVADYLPDFIRSIEAQTFGTSRVEVVAVNDGSTDRSLALLEAWQARRPDLVRVISQDNAGQGAARNTGLAAATGTWVTFTDPDDMLDPAFLAVADAFASSHESVMVMASKPVIFDEAHNKVRDRHPRRGQYAAGNRLVDLRRYPVVFTGSSTVSIYRLDEIRRQELAFDSRIRPTFEDGHFAARFVLGIGDPLIGVLRDAQYLYRRRKSLTSTMQIAWDKPGRYSTIFDLGFLDLIARAKSAFGSVPAWLQNLLLYELSFYLVEDAAISSKIRLPADMADHFHERFGMVVRELDPAVINRFTLRAFQPATKDLLLHGFRDEPWSAASGERTKVDTKMGLTRYAYRYRGSPPSETLTVGGRTVHRRSRRRGPSPSSAGRSSRNGSCGSRRGRTPPSSSMACGSRSSMRGCHASASSLRSGRSRSRAGGRCGTGSARARPRAPWRRRAGGSPSGSGWASSPPAAATATPGW